MFDRLLFVQVGDYYRLRCPKCGQVDPEEITGAVLSVLSFQDAHSFCIDCDPQARVTIPYRLPEGEQLADRRGLELAAIA